MDDVRVHQLKYDRARLSLIRLIAESGIQVGDRLPAERELVKHLPCSMITLRRALSDMEASGLIIRRHGAGTYLAQEMKNDQLKNFVLFIHVHRPGDLALGVELGTLQVYLADRGIGLRFLSVQDFGINIAKAAGEGCMGILTSGWLTDSFVEQLKSLDLPVVVLGNNQLKVKVPSVSLDIEEAVCRMTGIMVKGGLKHIAFVGSAQQGYYVAVQEEKGYRRAMEMAGLIPELIFSEDDLSYYDAIDRYMSENEEVDGLLLELSAYADFSVWLWEHDDLRKPSIGLLGTLPVKHHYHASSRFMWMGFDSIPHEGGRMLLDYILEGRKMQDLKLRARPFPGE